jgi:hypothetical protein
MKEIGGCPGSPLTHGYDSRTTVRERLEG